MDRKTIASVAYFSLAKSASVDLGCLQKGKVPFMAETSLTTVDQGASLAKPVGFGPQTFAEALQFAAQLAKSQLVPKHYQNSPENILVAIQHGAELGLPPMQALSSIAVINGTPGIFGDAALAIVKGHRDFEWIKETFDDNTMTAKCIVKRRGEPEVEQTFSKADAERAGLWDDRKTIKKKDSNYEFPNPSPWYCYPKRMLKFRARGFALRDAFPDALRGIKTAEEIADYPQIDDGRTIDGGPVSTQTAQEETKQEPPKIIGKEGGTEFFKTYRKHGWTSEEAAKWLSENLQIGKPHNDKDSRDILESDREKAMKWAQTKAPILQRIEEMFGFLGFTKDEAAAFVNERKADWAKIEADAKAEIDKRDAQER